MMMKRRMRRMMNMLWRCWRDNAEQEVEEDDIGEEEVEDDDVGGFWLWSGWRWGWSRGRWSGGLKCGGKAERTEKQKWLQASRTRATLEVKRRNTRWGSASSLCEDLCARSPWQVLCRSCCARSVCKAICARCLYEISTEYFCYIQGRALLSVKISVRGVLARPPGQDL